MAKKKKYIALFVKEIQWSSGRSPVATITAGCIYALTGISERIQGPPSESYSLIMGKTKEEIIQNLKKQRIEDNLFHPSFRKLSKDAEIIIVPKK